VRSRSCRASAVRWKVRTLRLAHARAGADPCSQRFQQRLLCNAARLTEAALRSPRQRHGSAGRGALRILVHPVLGTRRSGFQPDCGLRNAGPGEFLLVLAPCAVDTRIRIRWSVSALFREESMSERIARQYYEKYWQAGLSDWSPIGITITPSEQKLLARF